MTKKSQELIIKKVEELCAKLVKNYEEWNREREEFRKRIEREGGDKPEKENEYQIEEKGITEKHVKKRSEVLREIKDQILADLTLWELDLEGNIQPIPGVSVNTYGAGGGYILFGYDPGTSYIHFFNEFNENYHREITRALVEEIKKSPQDWEIIIEDERDVPFVEKPMVANRGDNQVVKHKSGRRHKRGYQWYKNEKGEVEGPGFSDEEWAEIENSLKISQSEKKGIQPDSKEKNSKKLSNFPPKWAVVIGITIFLLTAIIAIKVYKSKRPNY